MSSLRKPSSHLLRIALVSGAAECRARLRDRSMLAGALVVAVVLPLVMNLATGGGVGSSYVPTIAVVVSPGDQVAASIADALVAREDLELSLLRVDDESRARSAVRSGDADAAVVLPSGMEGLIRGEPVPLVTVVAASTAPLAGDVATAVATSIEDRLTAVAAAAELASESGVAQDLVTVDVLDAIASSGVDLSLPDLEGTRPSPLAYFGPSLTILAAIFLCGASARSLAGERVSGVAERWAAAPAPWWAHDMGVASAAALMALAVSVTSWAVATVAFGVSWGDPVGVLLLLASSACVAAGINLAVLRLAGRAGNRIDGASAAVVLLIGMIGGHFVPLYQLPTPLRRVALATPSGWSLRAFSDMVLLDGSMWPAVRASVVVTLMAIALCVLAFRAQSPAVGR